MVTQFLKSINGYYFTHTHFHFLSFCTSVLSLGHWGFCILNVRMWSLHNQRKQMNTGFAVFENIYTDYWNESIFILRDCSFCVISYTVICYKTSSSSSSFLIHQFIFSKEYSLDETHTHTLKKSHAHSHLGQICLSQSIYLYVSGRWEETGVPGSNPWEHSENMRKHHEVRMQVIRIWSPEISLKCDLKSFTEIPVILYVALQWQNLIHCNIYIYLTVGEKQSILKLHIL